MARQALGFAVPNFCVSDRFPYRFNLVELTLINTDKLFEKTCESLIQNLSIDHWEQYIEKERYRKTCDNLPLHPDVLPSFLDEGSNFAREGKIKEAISLYKEAQKFDPDIDLNPDTDEIETNPKQVANKLFAPTKLEQGRSLARTPIQYSKIRIDVLLSNLKSLTIILK